MGAGNPTISQETETQVPACLPAPAPAAPRNKTYFSASKTNKKNIYFYFIDYAKAFDCVDHDKLWKVLKEMGIPDHLTCLLRNLYAGQEATDRTGHRATDWFQLGKGVRQAVYCHPAYLTYMQSTS